ncbi:MAG: restriction endonuclease [Candidatus Paceibacterota bacterium]|jgi:broad-specificity NMP kinase
MNDYDFSQINDKRFEMLACDLLSEYLKKRVERFKPGKDGGIDGRFFANNKEQTIIQCKHYLKTGYKRLLADLKNKELAKIKKINPKRYIIATSLPLSASNKEEIAKTLSPYIIREDDIFGREDLNDLLSKNCKIEEKYIELWISSSNVLIRMLNNAIEGRSEDEIKRIIKEAKKYVKTKNHRRALELLRKNRIIIISGEPGIGKTTLAENLCLHFISKDYKFYDIEEDLSEAEQVFCVGEKQIFYFDDFLGAYYFEAMENKKDSHIVSFIRRVSLDDSKIFILTSRTNILNSGIEYSSQFENKNIRKNEFTLIIEDITDIEKAKILYNHIWFSEMKKEYVDEIYKERRYMHIIKHKNFNPRLIEFITDADRLIDVKTIDYYDYIKAKMDNPLEVWEKCFKTQSNDYIRNLVCLVVFNGGKISANDLRESFNHLNKLEELRNNSNTEKDFNSISRLAIKFFLNRGNNSGEIMYSLFNPSIGDYIINEYKQNPDKLTHVISALGSIKSLEQLSAMEFEKRLTPKVLEKVKEDVFYNASEGDRSYDYLIYLFDRFKNDKEVSVELLRRIIKEPKPIKEVSRFLSLLKQYEEDLKFGDHSFLLKCISDYELSEDEIKDFADFLEYYEINDENILSLLRSNLKSFLTDELYNEKDNIDLSKIVDISYREDGNEDVNYDKSTIEEELTETAKQIVKDFKSDIITDLSYDVYMKVVGEIYIDGMVDDYLFSRGKEYHGDYEDHTLSNKQDNLDDAIHDLFDRS